MSSHIRTAPFLALISAAALVALAATGCATDEREPEGNRCTGAKCDSLGDTGDGPAELAAGCYASQSTGAVRCVEPGLAGLAGLITSGFDPIAPLQCEDVFVGEPTDPAVEQAIFDVVMPICQTLPYCSFRSSSGACTASWPFVGETLPEGQCEMIDQADISASAKASFCAVPTCEGGSCEQSCTSYTSASDGSTRCLASGTEALAEMTGAGEMPILDLSCSEVSNLADTMQQAGMDRQESLDKMRSICEAVPQCLFKESGDFCMPIWEIVGSASPQEQCVAIDRAATTEAAKQAYCDMPIEDGCIGNTCTACQWTAGAGGPGSCTAVTMANGN